jgi:hypothetical protein
MFFPGANLIEGRGHGFFEKIFCRRSERNCGELLYNLQTTTKLYQNQMIINMKPFTYKQ